MWCHDSTLHLEFVNLVALRLCRLPIYNSRDSRDVYEVVPRICSRELDSSSAMTHHQYGACQESDKSLLDRVLATAALRSASSAARLAKARVMYLRNAVPVDSNILSTLGFL